MQQRKTRSKHKLAIIAASQQVIAATVPTCAASTQAYAALVAAMQQACMDSKCNLQLQQVLTLVAAQAKCSNFVTALQQAFATSDATHTEAIAACIVQQDVNETLQKVIAMLQYA